MDYGSMIFIIGEYLDSWQCFSIVAQCSSLDAMLNAFSSSALHLLSNTCLSVETPIKSELMDAQIPKHLSAGLYRNGLSILASSFITSGADSSKCCSLEFEKHNHLEIILLAELSNNSAAKNNSFGMEDVPTQRARPAFWHHLLILKRSKAVLVRLFLLHLPHHTKIMRH